MPFLESNYGKLIWTMAYMIFCNREVLITTSEWLQVMKFMTFCTGSNNYVSQLGTIPIEMLEVMVRLTDLWGILIFQITYTLYKVRYILKSTGERKAIKLHL